MMYLMMPCCEFDDCREDAAYIARRLASMPWIMCCAEHSKFIFMFDYGERYALVPR